MISTFVCSLVLYFGIFIYKLSQNSKYLYDVGKKAFVNKAGELAPKAYQKLLENPKVIKAIVKGLEILGY